MRRLVHSKVELALHEMRGGSGGALLHLHGLGEATPESLPAAFAAWSGPVYGLDFTGHGASTVPAGGGYTAEYLMADADAALAALGACTLYGRGLGAYIALLLAGGRATGVHGAILDDGPGLFGGGPRPGSPPLMLLHAADATPDPIAFFELSHDVRPPDYAAGFVRMALERSALEEPIAVCARARPDWLDAVAAEPGVAIVDLGQALRMYTGA